MASIWYDIILPDGGHDVIFTQKSAAIRWVYMQHPPGTHAAASASYRLALLLYSSWAIVHLYFFTYAFLCMLQSDRGKAWRTCTELHEGCSLNQKTSAPFRPIAAWHWLRSVAQPWVNCEHQRNVHIQLLKSSEARHMMLSAAGTGPQFSHSLSSAPAGLTCRFNSRRCMKRNRHAHFTTMQTTTRTTCAVCYFGHFWTSNWSHILLSYCSCCCCWSDIL